MYNKNLLARMMMIAHLTLILPAVLGNPCGADSQCCGKYVCDKLGFKKFQKAFNVVGDFGYYKYNCEICSEELTPKKIRSVRYNVSLNQFASMASEEFLKTMLNIPISLSENLKECETNIPPVNGDIPDSINWYEKNAVTPVQDQKGCVSSWAFSAVGLIEAYRVIKQNETLMPLSAQHLIDCSTATEYGNDGCYGGDIMNALHYVQTKGISTESDYPYVGKEPHECQAKKKNSIRNLAQDFRCIPAGDENQLKAIVSQFGPVAVYVDARSWDFRFYSSGIYEDNECCNHKRCLHHAMLLVGYGTDEGVDYWLLKNSWGEEWGENGYMRIMRNANNTCGIATAGLYLV